MLRYSKVFIFSNIIFIIVLLLGGYYFLYNKKSLGSNIHNIASTSNIIINKTNKKDIVSTYNNLCDNNKILCKKIYFNGSYTEKEKATYGILTLYFTQALDAIIGGDMVKTAIEKIQISSEKSTRRGYSTDTSVFLYTYGIGYKEYIMVLIHELGHIIDLGVQKGDSDKKDPYFTEFGEKKFSINDPSIIYYTISRDSERQRKLNHTKESFCSIYAMTNPFEDFAECFQLYINHQKYFEKIIMNNSILEKKYTFIKNIMDGKYIYKTLHTIDNADTPGYRYRDTTRMSKDI